MNLLFIFDYTINSYNSIFSSILARVETAGKLGGTSTLACLNSAAQEAVKRQVSYSSTLLSLALFSVDYIWLYASPC